MYERLAHFAQTWGLVYFVILFLIVLAYALWPKNKKRFEEDSKIPFRED